MRFFTYIINATLATAALLLATGCSRDSQHIKLISQQGIDDALRLAEAAPRLSQTALEYELLEIRARENDYRTQMGDAEAKAYIEAFETNLRQANDSLANIIFTHIEPTENAD